MQILKEKRVKALKGFSKLTSEGKIVGASYEVRKEASNLPSDISNDRIVISILEENKFEVDGIPANQDNLENVIQTAKNNTGKNGVYVIASSHITESCINYLVEIVIKLNIEKYAVKKN